MTTTTPQADSFHAALALHHDKFPDQVENLLGELQPIFVDVQEQMLGALYHRVIQLHENEQGKINKLSVFKRIRLKKPFKKQLIRITDNLHNRIKKKINYIVSRSYKIGLRNIISVWNQYTPKGFKMTFVVRNSEIDSILQMPIEGFTVQEWIRQYIQEFQIKIIGQSNRFITQNAGDITGRTAYMKQLRNTLEILKRKIKDIARHVANNANQKAYLDENELLSDDKEWVYR